MRPELPGALPIPIGRFFHRSSCHPVSRTSQTLNWQRPLRAPVITKCRQALSLFSNERKKNILLSEVSGHYIVIPWRGGFLFRLNS